LIFGAWCYLLALKIVSDVLARIEDSLADFHECQFAAKTFIADGARLDVEQFSDLPNV
jgi:hypothetical protein